MKRIVACLLVVSLGACDQDQAPADEVAANVAAGAQKIVSLGEPTPTPTPAGRYSPRDTCGAVPGAEAFRTRLQQVVEARDTDGLVNLAASDVKLDFGGGSGTEALRKRLTSDKWDLWDALDKLMKLGCSANAHGGITIPWYFDQKIDPTAGMLVTGDAVPLLAAPAPDSQRLETISWDVVRLQALEPDESYQQVQMLDGTDGYIATDRLRSLLDYRLIASRRNGKWSITSFAAGD